HLWAHGVSGDWPIVLATIDAPAGLPTLRQLFAAHRYWRRRGMMVDVVVLNARHTSYLQELHDQIVAAVYSVEGGEALDKPGGVSIRRRDLIDAEGLLMLRATARAHILCEGRSLGRLLAAVEKPPPDTVEETAKPPAPVASRLWERRITEQASPVSVETPRLTLDNGFGGLPPQGDYLIPVRGDLIPPAPRT